MPQPIPSTLKPIRLFGGFGIFKLVLLTEVAIVWNVVLNVVVFGLVFKFYQE